MQCGLCDLCQAAPNEGLDRCDNCTLDQGSRAYKDALYSV
jgi:hypothetical protein